ncbi:MAG TPA: FAD binding domain-containing protein [Patescibacteria group bacterium]|nr:FAD binding domain-containing protein [Patescibacteria group bacterium]
MTGSASTAGRTAARFRFTVNDRPVEVAVPGGRRLLDVLRLDLGLTGSKEGCGEGECGACSVLLDGAVVDSCLVPICQVEGRAVRTVEGLVAEGRLDPLQAALIETGGVQCGICTPGMLMAGRAFLDARASAGQWDGRIGGPDAAAAMVTDAMVADAAIREAIAGNLCRCTGYGRIVEAIRRAREGRVPAMAAPDAAAAPSAGPDRAGLDLGDPDVVTPRTLAHACALLAEGGRRPVAGGTDVLVERAAGLPGPSCYLDLAALAELRGTGVDDGALVLGAATTYAELRRDPLVAEHAPVLAAMAAEIGAAQIQNRGTLGGNIATASPAGDSLPVLLALDAEIVVAGLRGERTIPAAAFFPAYRRPALAADELILRVRVPIVPARTVVFGKVGTRRAQAISVVVMAVAWRWGGGQERGTWRDVRVALGSVAPTPIRARATEAALDGAPPTPEVAALAAATLAAEIAPIDDVRSTAEYRRAVAGRVLHRIIRDGAGW